MGFPPGSRLVLVLCLGSCHSTAAPGSVGIATLSGGTGSMGSTGLQNYDAPAVLQIQYAELSKNDGLGPEIGMQLAFSEGTESGGHRNMDTGDLYMGIAKGWDIGSQVRLLGGAGARVSRMTLSVPYGGAILAADESTGVYAHIGLWLRVAGPILIGADVRWADGFNYHLEGVSRDAHLTQLTFGLSIEF